MANVPSDLKYTKDHEWVRSVTNDRVRIGITEFAQRQLGDIVFVELPGVGTRVELGDPFGTVESVKAVSEIYAPVPGTIAAVNDELNDSPELVNEDPYGEGWMIEITVTKAAEMGELLTAAEYEAYIAEETA
jgi:glycine cleavage system H protein